MNQQDLSTFKIMISVVTKEEPIDFIAMSEEAEEQPNFEVRHEHEFMNEILNGTQLELSEIPPNLSPEERKLYFYHCRMCSRKFSSRYAFTLHVNKHQRKCKKCRATFGTWKELENHREFCSRRFGTIDRRPERQERARKAKKLPFKCQLCGRKYETYKHLFQHQYLRCSKRYRTQAWIVKI